LIAPNRPLSLVAPEAGTSAEMQMAANQERDFINLRLVVHRQSSEGGTTTDILLCDTLGVGAGGQEPLILTRAAR
jgi:hypothetical protein